MSKRKEGEPEPDVPEAEDVAPPEVVEAEDVEAAEAIVAEAREKVGDASGALADDVNKRLDAIEGTLKDVKAKIEKEGGPVPVEDLTRTERATVETGREPGIITRALGKLDEWFQGGRATSGNSAGSGGEDSGRDEPEAAGARESGRSEGSEGE